MSILTTIGGIPLFSTLQEALNWANQRGLSGYHTHNYQGQVGYMGGATHANAINNNINNGNNNNNNNNTNNLPPARSSSGGNGAGGGSY